MPKPTVLFAHVLTVRLTVAMFCDIIQRLGPRQHVAEYVRAAIQEKLLREPVPGRAAAQRRKPKGIT